MPKSNIRPEDRVRLRHMLDAALEIQQYRPSSTEDIPVLIAELSYRLRASNRMNAARHLFVAPTTAASFPRLCHSREGGNPGTLCMGIVPGAQAHSRFERRLDPCLRRGDKLTPSAAAATVSGRALIPSEAFKGLQ